MDQSINKRINLSDKIFPFYCGLSMDLVFFIAINTLFLTSVKGLTSSEINLTTTIGVLVALLFYLVSHKIINKIGNVYSIRFGTFLMLISAILFTISSNIILFIIAEVLYEVSFAFKCVESVILNNNLIYEKKENYYIKIRFKATTIYSIATLFATLIGGVLFNINPYLPMIICILVCLLNFILSFFIYEVKIGDNNKNEKKKKFSINKIILLTILVYGLIFGAITVCQTNDKMFIQYELQEFLNTKNVALIMSLVLFLSRVSRLVSNLIFNRIYDKIKDKMIYIVYCILLVSVLLFVLGKILLSPLYASIMMAIGFFLLLMLRDPTENILSNILLKNTKKENKEQAMLYFQFTRRLIVFILSLLATLILSKYELINLYILFLGLIILYSFIIYKLVSLLNKN